MTVIYQAKTEDFQLSLSEFLEIAHFNHFLTFHRLIINVWSYSLKTYKQTMFSHWCVHYHTCDSWTHPGEMDRGWSWYQNQPQQLFRSTVGGGMMNINSPFCSWRRLLASWSPGEGDGGWQPLTHIGRLMYVFALSSLEWQEVQRGTGSTRWAHGGQTKNSAFCWQIPSFSLSWEEIKE